MVQVLCVSAFGPRSILAAMPSSFRPDINPELLRWARERGGLSVEDLNATFHKNYGEWEAGRAKPTFKQVEKLAKRTHAPLGYFFLSKPPAEKLPIPDFRTVNNAAITRTSAELLDTIYEMQRRQDWLRDYLIEQGVEELAFVGSASTRDDPGDVAQSIRDVLGLNLDWASHLAPSTPLSSVRKVLRDAAEEAGVTVVINGVIGNNTSRTLDAKEFRGFVLTDSYAPLVFVNGSDAMSAQIFTLAHELAHVWIGEGGILDVRAEANQSIEAERFCNKVAAELTVPRTVLAELWMQYGNSAADPFSLLSKRFKVSPAVVAIRAKETGLITRAALDSFMGPYKARVDDLLERDDEPRASSGGNFYLTQPGRIGDRFFRRVVEATRSGRLLYRDAYRLTNLKPDTFENYAHRIMETS